VISTASVAGGYAVDNVIHTLSLVLGQDKTAANSGVGASNDTPFVEAFMEDLPPLWDITAMSPHTQMALCERGS
ncbi:MAG: hypothetical protein ABJZ69_10305, partial [Hyphomicrobiales bacterium]